jgi:hypothetical protein
MIMLKDLRIEDLFVCYDMNMNQDKIAKLPQGLSVEDAQYAICQGTYGGKEWSSPERYAACQRYEELTNKELQSSPNSINSSAIATSLALLIIVVCLSYLYINKRQMSRKVNARKASRK